MQFKSSVVCQTLEVNIYIHKSIRMNSINFLTSYLRLFGVLPHVSDRGWNLGIISNSVFSGICVMCILSDMWYLTFTAQTFSEYLDAFYCVLHFLVMITWYFFYLTQRKSYDSLVFELNEIIEKSESQYIFN